MNWTARTLALVALSAVASTSCGLYGIVAAAADELSASDATLQDNLAWDDFLAYQPPPGPNVPESPGPRGGRRPEAGDRWGGSPPNPVMERINELDRRLDKLTQELGALRAELRSQGTGEQPDRPPLIQPGRAPGYGPPGFQFPGRRPGSHWRGFARGPGSQGWQPPRESRWDAPAGPEAMDAQSPMHARRPPFGPHMMPFGGPPFGPPPFAGPAGPGPRFGGMQGPGPWGFGGPRQENAGPAWGPPRRPDSDSAPDTRPHTDQPQQPPRGREDGPKQLSPREGRGPRAEAAEGSPPGPPRAEGDRREGDRPAGDRREGDSPRGDRGRRGDNQGPQVPPNRERGPSFRPDGDSSPPGPPRREGEPQGRRNSDRNPGDNQPGPRGADGPGPVPPGPPPQDGPPPA